LFAFYLALASRRLGALESDDFLGELHALYAMDDTVIMATSRATAQKKMEVFYAVASELGMVIHPDKTKFMVVGAVDKAPLPVGQCLINPCSQYVYLGTPILPENITNQVECHIASKQCHLRKFSSFIARNFDSPYQVKHQVWKSALSSAILYSCETWWTTNLRAANSALLISLKELLSVRTTTCTDIVYIESGETDAKTSIIKQQLNFLQRISSRPDFGNTYLGRIIQMCERAKTPMGKYATYLKSSFGMHVEEAFLAKLRQSLRESQSSKRQTYLEMNPTLSAHEMYNTDTSHIKEHHRIAATRIRAVSHNFRVETGRWSRLPLERRTCECGRGVQTEEHVLCHCPLTQDIRRKFQNINFNDISLVMKSSPNELCELCFLINKLFA
jgi:hypothetical protein